MDATQERKGEGGRERGDGERQEEERHSTMMRISIWRPAALRLLCGRRNGRRGARRTVLDGSCHVSAEVSKSRVQDFANDEWKGALEAVKAASLFSKWL